MNKFIKLFCVALLVVSCSKKEEASKTDLLTITTPQGEVVFNIETATTPDEMKKGLMDRTEIADNSGMIFDINPTRPITMWMKDTKISLDMLFIDSDGTILSIKENAVPMSEELISSNNPVRAVVELKGGQVAQKNIAVGDKVKHKIFEEAPK